jgi:hypothetical protein
MFLYDWQNLIAGVFALLAGLITVWVINKQIKTTVRLERGRVASEASAFHAMLAAAMTRVIAEADWAKKNYSEILAQMAGSTVEALTVRQCITKGAFAELRAACVRRGGDLTGDFLDLEREIDSFALQYEYYPAKTMGELIRLGKHAGLREQLDSIVRDATALHDKAVERI